MPTRVTYTREIDFDRDGGVWTSNSNTPGWQIETAAPQIIRLRESGAPKAAAATIARAGGGSTIDEIVGAR